MKNVTDVYLLYVRMFLLLACVDWWTGDYYDMCSICLEDFKDGDRLRILHCSHGQRVTCGLYFDSNDDTKGTICYSTDTQTHAFNGHLSGTTRLSRYQNGKTNHVKALKASCCILTVKGHRYTVEENSDIFCLVWMLWLLSTRACR